MFKSRLISGILLVILALITVGKGGYLLAATLWFISIIAFHELCLACEIQKDKKRQNTLEVVGYIFTSLYYVDMAILKNYQLMIMIVVMALIILLLVLRFYICELTTLKKKKSFFSYCLNRTI